ncbi:hypothetical protein BD413DRAFT_520023 [Trametes elegans]|nr:hypothetical protein BD413DRAFT_520023 [Trametes elegans]
MVRFKTGGSIILVASLAAHVYIPGLKILPYSITKAGVVQMTRGLACDFAQDGIRVNSISPGFFNTPYVATAAPREISPAHLRAALSGCRRRSWTRTPRSAPRCRSATR